MVLKCKEPSAFLQIEEFTVKIECLHWIMPAFISRKEINIFLGNKQFYTELN